MVSRTNKRLASHFTARWALGRCLCGAPLFCPCCNNFYAQGCSRPHGVCASAGVSREDSAVSVEALPRRCKASCQFCRKLTESAPCAYQDSFAQRSMYVQNYVVIHARIEALKVILEMSRFVRIVSVNVPYSNFNS